MPSYIELRKLHIREAIADVQRKLSIPTHAIRVEPMYKESVIIYFNIAKARPFQRDIIRERFEELCLTHGWQPPRIDRNPTYASSIDDYVGFTVDMRRTSWLSKSEALLPA